MTDPISVAVASPALLASHILPSAIADADADADANANANADDAVAPSTPRSAARMLGGHHADQATIRAVTEARLRQQAAATAAAAASSGADGPTRAAQATTRHLIARRIRSQYDRATVFTTLSTLATLLGNVVAHPDEEKYRRLREANPRFRTAVLDVDGAPDVLLAAGFHVVVSSFERIWTLDWPKAGGAATEPSAARLRVVAAVRDVVAAELAKETDHQQRMASYAQHAADDEQSRVARALHAIQDNRERVRDRAEREHQQRLAMAAQPMPPRSADASGVSGVSPSDDDSDSPY
ncbi:hypothetical protein CXG81DRAFT_18593 [Caulochytrium protostelioides]|uniref:PUB domain-containing protein n=1 Tax=Caulochytrium protostelioides TaxID=1555241 RepID=A0A4P9X8M5_9FUNG|nr:hypothetical protein CXG81DRAFT_18593 [Caulochytrium protostelioides]|eukprot:RKP01653.1 hypothetical protein CXG81DRAFT_18593 [Caulochytrium protostelioides]